jgi:hypothetical protein
MLSETVKSGVSDKDFNILLYPVHKFEQKYKSQSDGSEQHTYK